MPDLLRVGQRAAAGPAVDLPTFENFSVANGLARDAPTLEVSEYYSSTSCISSR